MQSGALADVELIHDAMVGKGGLPGDPKIMDVYMKKGYTLHQLAQVWGYFFIVQTHGYAQLNCTR